MEPVVIGSPASMVPPSLISGRMVEPYAIEYTSESPDSGVTMTSLFFFVSIICTVPLISEIIACPRGFLASNSSSTLGRPCVMSPPATPPVWNVLIVSCVPGSPMD